MRFASVNIHQHTHATSVMLIVCIIQAQLPGLSLANGLLTPVSYTHLTLPTTPYV